MKLLWKRYGWNIVLLCNIFFISFFLLKATTKLEQISRMANQPISGISDSSIQFFIDASDTIDFCFLTEEAADFALLMKASDASPIFKVVYAHNYFEVETGRAFTWDDFENGRQTVLCGIHTEEIIDTGNHEVIGRLQNRNTVASQFGAYFCDGDIRQCRCQYIFILDGTSQKQLQAVYKRIEEEMANNGCTLRPVTTKSVQLKNLLDTGEMALEIGILLFVLNVSTLVLLIYFWLGSYDEVCVVYRLLGLRHFSGHILKQFLALATGGFVLAYLLIPGTSFGIALAIYVLLILFTGMVMLISILKKWSGDWNEKSTD